MEWTDIMAVIVYFIKYDLLHNNLHCHVQGFHPTVNCHELVSKVRHRTINSTYWRERLSCARCTEDSKRQDENHHLCPPIQGTTKDVVVLSEPAWMVGPQPKLWNDSNENAACDCRVYARWQWCRELSWINNIDVKRKLRGQLTTNMMGNITLSTLTGPILGHLCDIFSNT